VTSPYKNTDKAPALEVIFNEPQHSFRWYQHDYPFDLARWNHHPEFEIHLIREGSGRLLAGDYIGLFEAGHVALIGPGLPHDWISDLGKSEVISGRDVVLQFDGQAMMQLRNLVPELNELQSLFRQAARGIEFSGVTRKKAAGLLEQIGLSHGFERLCLFLSLLQLLASAPDAHKKPLASLQYAPMLDALTAQRMSIVFDYILNDLADELRLSVIAQRLEMSEPAFSKFFKRATGHTFVDLTRKLRVQRACRLLAQSELSVASICFEVGYANLSNFNRHFRHEMQETPSEYRQRLQRVVAAS
jgi:AraC-like DNA-binding protein